MKFLAIASFSLLLAACTAPQAPPDVVAQPVEPTAPVATSIAPAPKRAPGPEAAGSLQIFRAFGNEPFWNVNVQGGQLTFTTPEDQQGTVLQGVRAATGNGGMDISGSQDGNSFLLRVRTGNCSDGMSDNQYSMTSAFRMGDAVYTGCAEAAK
ncbi:hypothetical protein [Thermomonas sp.]|uniref:COG3650 family protein n=1 Tax=Thermomonas sp. TaxID=1971895 RepID=UPI00248920D3|nr:hypothetical protein [Thermomonas sp.]MDI1251695.1 hypothetical protein [Thermomonas sp.]